MGGGARDRPADGSTGLVRPDCASSTTATASAGNTARRSCNETPDDIFTPLPAPAVSSDASLLAAARRIPTRSGSCMNATPRRCMSTSCVAPAAGRRRSISRPRPWPRRRLSAPGSVTRPTARLLRGSMALRATCCWRKRPMIRPAVGRLRCPQSAVASGAAATSAGVAGARLLALRAGAYSGSRQPELPVAWRVDLRVGECVCQSFQAAADLLGRVCGERQAQGRGIRAAREEWGARDVGDVALESAWKQRARVPAVG